MKSQNTTRILYGLVAGLVFSLQGMAQSGVGDYISAGLGDANTLLGNYMNPLFNAMGNSQTNGWYQTAKPLKPFRGDVTSGITMSFVPSADRSFTFRNSDYNRLQLSSGSSADLPTIFGGESSRMLEVRDNGNQVGGFEAPDGVIPINFMPLPFVQASVGLPYKSEVSFRYLPDVAGMVSDESGIGMGGYGFAVKHDLMQWIPVVGDKIPLDVSFFFAYNHMNMGFDLKVDPKYESGSSENPQETNYNNQRMELNSGAWTTRLLASKKLLFLTVYGGLGYNRAKSSLLMSGNYPVTYYDSQSGNEVVENYRDPIDISSTDASGFAFNAGFRLKFLWVVTFHADYTLAHYQAFTTGIGININI